VQAIVSFDTSKRTRDPARSITVRHTPLTAMLSPSATSSSGSSAQSTMSFTPSSTV